ncbi:MAG: DUF6049 family protein [Microthrixaceae bacterium]
MRGHWARAGGLVAAVLLLATATWPAPARSDPIQSATPTLELVRQTPTVGRGGTFDVWVRLSGVPADAGVELILHGRVRSRSELAASMEGDALRTQIYNVVTTVASLPVAADGTRQISLSLDPAASGGVPLTAAGAYPLEIEVQDASGAPLTGLVTHLLVRPADTDTSPPLSVAVVARVDLPPALRPDGSSALPAAAIDSAAAFVAKLAATPNVPITLAVRPETIDALAASDDPSAPVLLDQLRVAARGREALALPYVDVSPAELVADGLGEELARSSERGRQVLLDALGVRPTDSTWLATTPLDHSGLEALQQQGVRHLVVDADHVKPLRSGLLSLSLAQPFLISSEAATQVDAMALDPMLTDRLDTNEDPGLEVSRLLAELAMLWFEQPGISRGVVLPVDPTVRADVVQGLLAGLDASGILAPVTLDTLFDDASPLRQPGGERVDRPLAEGETRTMSPRFVDELRATRAQLASFTGLIGDESPRADPVSAHLLLATAVRLSGSTRAAHVRAARTAMDDVISAVSGPARSTITLTAREGTVPLTMRNASGLPVHVVVHLRSPKLEFPDGDTLPLVLTDPTTRLDVAVRTRASGSFPLEITVTSPDGVLQLGAVRVSVQSTAVSGVGLVLSIGAACFLLVWWARHWRRTRRSAKLVASAHPAATSRTAAGN